MKVFFLHVEKCGGTSFSDAMRRLQQNADDSPTPVFQLDAKAAWATSTANELPPWVLRDMLLQYLLASKHTRFVSGHFRFRPEKHGSFIDSGWTFATLLRNPVDRFLSHYYYNRFKDEEHGQIQVDLEAYLDVPRAKVAASLYVRMLQAGDPWNRELDARDVKEACNNLSRFKLVGVLEHLDLFQVRCKQVLGKKLDMPELNTSPAGRKRREPIPDALLRRVEAICEPSMEVYRHALSMIGAPKDTS